MRRLAVLVVVLPFLAGCSDADWNNAMSFVGMGGSGNPAASNQAAMDQAAATPAPQSAPAGAPNSLCLAVARQDATGNDFDQATQQRVAARSYQQCVAIFGNAD